MQSQQKRVKWSRGETAEALEERADTGITSASVELMENCIPDIYGNISRRPAFKAIPYGEHYFDYSPTYTYGFKWSRLTDIIPFYISETDYILIGVRDSAAAEMIRIRNGECVYKRNMSPAFSTLGKVKSYAQQNNYLLIAGGARVIKVTFTLAGNDYEFTPNVEFWTYSAGWYAPNGTQTKVVNGTTQGLSNFRILGASASPYAATDVVGISTDYTAFSVATGSYGPSSVTAITNAIPLGSIIYMQNTGCYFRVEGYFYNFQPFSNITFNGVLNAGDSVPATGKYCRATNSRTLECWENQVLTGVITMDFNYTTITVTVKNSASSSGYSNVNYTSSGFITNWTVNGTQNYSVSTWMYGSLLTPIADSQGVDNFVNVEYGYVNLTPASFATGGGTMSNVIYPHPEQLCFNDQRLWAGSWVLLDSISNKQYYSVVIGSQIARYNDLKNDYNQENEAITLDILTKYKEKIVHIIDYNGLKIMTDSFEYAYEGGGVVKQSANGSLEDCAPIIFDSLCLYADKTGNQIKAMQYELQSNIFNSTTINQMAPHDLVWFPVGMASYEDKIYSTGKYLFVANTLHNTTPVLGVCNFVPGNQANIWNRWSIPKQDSGTINGLFNVLDMKDNALFLLVAYDIKDNGSPTVVVIPCVLDFTGNADLMGTIQNGAFNIDSATVSTSTFRLTLINTEVNIYKNGVYDSKATTSNNGYLVGVTDGTAGMSINATIRSHPIDVGGKTKSIKKRIGKARMSVRDTESGAITINDKTGYMNPAKDYISFYGVTGMKNEIKYIITNKNGAMFHLESLLMNIEYGTLDS